MTLLKISSIVAHIESTNADISVGWIVEFDKTSIVERRVDEHIHVSCHDFINDEGFGISIVLANGDGAGCRDGRIIDCSCSDDSCTFCKCLDVSVFIYTDNGWVACTPNEAFVSGILWQNRWND